MKTITKTLMYLQMSALLLTTALAGAAASEKEKPFQGRIDAFETSVLQFPLLSVDASGSGHASHLGHFTMTSEFDVNFVTLAAGGSAHFIAANGDSVFTEFNGQAIPIEGSDFSSIVQAHTITGGTGRFAGATGSFTVERLLNRVTGVSSGSFDGTISY
ncbi:MAG: hypothetical protein ACXW3L_04640 [Limisphaerales bacterium]